ncbi:MAG: ComEC/Rec2 family competence protein, partial [Sphingomonas sp.]|nr:ComEC/Rec2 family competence protein [Sphingomonas sp.]
ALGLALVWARAERVAAPVLARPLVATLVARVERIEPLPPRGLVRLTLRVEQLAAPGPAPERVRLNLAAEDAPAGLSEGARLRLRARLLPPPPPAVPGAYDYARVAWFAGIGATGRGFAPVAILTPGRGQGSLRAALAAHIRAALPGRAGGIAAALATGDQGAIDLDDAEAMRRAGLAHLLSVSGLHITAVVGAVMLLVERLLALWPWAALHLRLRLIAAGAAAVAAIGYTWLTGAEVPTVRSCVAALLVLAALALGREALTLRLVAAGALVVLSFWPEALMGPSFQLSFAAVATIVALSEAAPMRAWLAPREEGVAARLGRHLVALLATGVVVEAALIPIGLFHFHKAGVYGALANIVAIPLTTFVVMPAEALALAADLIGLGAPFWAVTGWAIDALLWLARVTAAAPGAVALLPAMPVGAFALIVGGGLWLVLWRTRWRLWGLAPALIGAAWTALTPAPDLLVTGDGRHVAFRLGDGRLAILRERTGDYVQALLGENAGEAGVPWLIDASADARCSADLCLVERRVGARRWRILATRSSYPLPYRALIAACAEADIAISERRLPRACAPRWLKLDRATLARSGGVAIWLPSARVATVARAGDAHPWVGGKCADARGSLASSFGNCRSEMASADNRRGVANPAKPNAIHQAMPKTP